MSVIRSWLAARRQQHLTRLASYLVAHPDQKHYGWDTAKATGLRPAVMYRLLWRFLDVGWLTDGWETPPPVGRPPRRYYVLTDLGRAELAGIAQAGEKEPT